MEKLAKMNLFLKKYKNFINKYQLSFENDVQLNKLKFYMIKIK